MCEENSETMIDPDNEPPVIKIPNPSQVASSERNRPTQEDDDGSNGDDENQEQLSPGENETFPKLPPSSPYSSSVVGGFEPISPEIEDVELGGVEVVIGTSEDFREEEIDPNFVDYDSDGLVIDESGEINDENAKDNEDAKDNENVISTGQNSPVSPSVTKDEQQLPLSPQKVEEPDFTPTNESCEIKNQINTKVHNLPIHELKRKLAFCSVCQTQHQNHKQANLCLSKHGKRQCWLCLEVMANTKDSYFQHCLRHHAIGSSGQNDIVGCPYCHKFFDFRQGFNQHIVKVHFSEDVSYLTNNNACLETLVDIFTGQPRTSKRLSSLPLDKVTTTSAARVNVNLDISHARMDSTEGGSSNCREQPPLPPPPLLFSNNSERVPSPSSSGLTSIDTRTTGDTSALAFSPSIPTSGALQDNISLPTKFNNYKSNGSGGGGGSCEDNILSGVTRESVIRETPQPPQPNLTHPMIRIQHPNEFVFFHHQHHGQSHPRLQQQPQHPPNYNSKVGKSNAFYGNLPQLKPFHSVQSQTVSKSITTTSAQQQFIISNRLNLPHQQQAQRSSFPSPNNSPSNRAFTPRPGHRNMDKLRYGGVEGQMSSSCDPPWVTPLHPSSQQYRYPNPQYLHNRPQIIPPRLQTICHKPSSISLFPGGTTTTTNHAQPILTHQHQSEQLSPIHRPLSQPASPCLLEMEKLIHSTPVQVQYFNSVNSMLKTVAECNPGGTDHFTPPPPFTPPTPHPNNSTPFTHHNQASFPFSGNLDHHQPHPSNNDPVYGSKLTISPPQLSPGHHQGKLSNGRRNCSTDSETFKVPSNGGIKRRILTNFLRDENQEIKTRGKPPHFFPSIVPSAFTPGVEYNYLVDEGQVEIHTGPNPINCGGGGSEGQGRRPSGSREDKHFWEQVLRESNGMYGGRPGNEQTAQVYNSPTEGQQNFELVGGVGHPSHGPGSHSSSSSCTGDTTAYGFTNLDPDPQNTFVPSPNIQHPHQNPGYPKIMARVDMNGRPVGIFTADGQPCTLSGHSGHDLDQHSQLFTAAEVTQTNSGSGDQGVSHLQYQHKIIRQVSSQGLRIGEQEGGGVNQGQGQSHNNFPTHRKRKSYLPVRLLPNISDCDNVVVQNPFEDEGSSGRGHLAQNHFESVTPPPGLVEGHNQMRPPPPPNEGQGVSSNHRFQLELNIQNQNFGGRRFQTQTGIVSKVDRFINYQPKFTSGGQITDFSGKNPCSQGGKVGKNFTNVSVATNIGVWNTGNNSVGIGVGLIKSTATSSTDLQLIRQHQTNSEYYESFNGGAQNQGGGSMSRGAGWPPFSVCQRYFETTQNIMSRIKNLDKQKKGHLI